MEIEVLCSELEWERPSQARDTTIEESYGSQGRVETHINWGRTNACNGKLIWYYI